MTTAATLSALRQRVVNALGANAFGQTVTVVIQLLSLPLFLTRWDPATYGIWLMLSAAPAYLAIADAGMVTAAGNRMNMAIGAGNLTLASTVFHSAIVFMAVVCGAVGLLAIPAALWLPIPGVVDPDQRTALALLACTVLANLVSGLADALFRSTGRYALGTALASLVRLLELFGAMVGLMFLGTYTAVAAGALAARLIGLGVLIVVSRQGLHGIAWGMQAASMAELRTSIGPALSFMVFPLANALSFQGMTLLVGHLFGPVAVALFNAYRTIARTAVQLTSMFSFALWAEFSRLFGVGGAPAVQHLYRRSAALGAALPLAVSPLLYFAAPWLLLWWTNGAIEFRPGLMLLMVAYATVGGMWHVPRVLMMAVNAHARLAIWALVTAALVLLLAAAVGPSMGLSGMAAATLVGELTIAVACVHMVHRFLRGATPVTVSAA